MKMEDFENMFSSRRSKLNVCQKHGEFISKLFKHPKSIEPKWSCCPDCSMEKIREIDRKEIEEINNNHKQAILCQIMGRTAIPERFINKYIETFQVKNKGQERALSSCKKYIENLDSNIKTGKCLILCGNPGTGKTHLSIGIARKIIDSGGTALYSRTIDVFRSVKETYGRGSDKTEMQVLKGFANPDLLILDEVGHQFGTDAEKIILFDLINSRYERSRPTIIITNLDIDGLKKYLDYRAMDRLREGGGQLIVFDWESMR